MPWTRRDLISQTVVTGSLGWAGLSRAAPRRYQPRVLEADAVVLGAGASGLYSAMHLRELGHRVIVLERSDRVGGHASTFREAGTGLHADLGVRYYPDLPIITETFAKFGVALHTVRLTDLFRSYFDPLSGEERPGVALADGDRAYDNAKMQALLQWFYSKLSEPGFELPFFPDTKLFQSYADFLRQFQLARSYRPELIDFQGYGHPDEVQALYALKILSQAVWKSLGKDSFWIADWGAQEIYEVMAKQLGDELFLATHLLGVKRDDSGVNVSFESQGGASEIRAKRLIVAFPPLLKNLGNFDLSLKERALFSGWSSRPYASALVRCEGLLPGYQLYAGLEGEEGLRTSGQGIRCISSTGIPGLHHVTYEAAEGQSEDAIKVELLRIFESLQGSYCYDVVKVLGIEAFALHPHYALQRNEAEIRSGIYQQLAQLQGSQQTYYVGAALSAHDTASVWSHARKLIDETIGPRL